MSENKGHDELALSAEWMARAKAAKTLDDLCLMYRDLFGGSFNHDYGTICRAMSAFMVAAGQVADDSSCGGITGFQASCVIMDAIAGWNGWKDEPFRLMQYNDLLHPQYEDKVKTIPKHVHDWLVMQAIERLQDVAATRQAHPDVVAHWRFIANGGVPFGLRVETK